MNNILEELNEVLIVYLENANMAHGVNFKVRKLAEYLRLDKNKEESLIRACKKNDISFLGLFGSYSRGEQREKSDIDLLASFSRRKSLLDLVRIERELSEILGVKVDFVTEKSLNPYLVDKIKGEVKTLYQRSQMGALII